MTSTVQNTATNQLFNSLVNNTGTGSNGTISQSDFSSLLLMAYSQGVADSQKFNGSTTTAPTAFTPYVQSSSSVLGTSTSKYQADEIMGKFVTAYFEGRVVSGYVTKIVTENGVEYASLNDGRDKEKLIPVNDIVKVEDKGPYPNKKMGHPPGNNWKHFDNRGYIEYADDGTELGVWEFVRKDWKWYLQLFDLQEPIIQTIIQEVLVPCEHDHGAEGEIAAEGGAGAEDVSITGAETQSSRSERRSSGESERSGRRDRTEEAAHNNPPVADTTIAEGAAAEGIADTSVAEEVKAEPAEEVKSEPAEEPKQEEKVETVQEAPSEEPASEEAA